MEPYAGNPTSLTLRVSESDRVPVAGACRIINLLTGYLLACVLNFESTSFPSKGIVVVSGKR